MQICWLLAIHLTTVMHNGLQLDDGNLSWLKLRMYFIIYLVKTDIPVCDILCVYCTIIRSILEYACPVWHPGLTKKNCLKILNEYKNAV